MGGLIQKQGLPGAAPRGGGVGTTTGTGNTDPRLTNAEVDRATAQKYRTQADSFYNAGNLGASNAYRAQADKLDAQAGGPPSIIGGAAGPPTGQVDRLGYNGIGYRGYDPQGYPQFTANADPSVQLTRTPTSGAVAPAGTVAPTGGQSTSGGTLTPADADSYFSKLQDLQKTDLAAQTGLNQQLVDQGKQLSTTQAAQQQQFQDTLLSQAKAAKPKVVKKPGGGFFGAPAAKTQLGGAMGALLGG